MNPSVARISLSISLILFATPVLAQWHGPDAPDSLSFQGLITDSNGVAITTTADITFKLYKGNTEVWSQTKTGTSITNGVFDVILGGAGEASLDTVAFNEPIDLEIKYGNIVLTPRTPLTSSAYALGMRGMYAVWSDDGSNKAPNLIGGASNNYVAEEVAGATIGGGGGWSGSLPRADSVLGDWGTIGGGERNTTDKYAATVGGGSNNAAREPYATVSGGGQNTAEGSSSTVGGGGDNHVTAIAGTIGGGLSNEASGDYSVVGGGELNDATSNRSTIAGGSNNTASGQFSAVSGGDNNTASNNYAVVSGGRDNIGSGNISTVAGGSQNVSSGDRTAVGGGFYNWASGQYATIPGGIHNRATRGWSFAAGQAAHALHAGTFVWADSVNNILGVPFESTDENQFLIRASGGVGIGTNAPARLLHLYGSDSVLRIDREESQGGAAILLHQYNGGAPDTPWNSFSVSASSSSAGVGIFEIRDLGIAVSGNGALRMKIDDAGFFGLNTGSSSYPLQVGTSGNTATGNGAHVTVDGIWTDASSRSFKTNFEEVDNREILDRLVSLPVTKWEYKDSGEGAHIGPVAEDFYAAFELGNNDRYIGGTDARGVSMAAIKGLYELVKEQQNLIAAQNKRIEQLEARFT